MAAGKLNTWREIRWRIETLQRAALPHAAKARLTTDELLNRLYTLRTLPVGGEPFPQRIIRLGLTNRKETLAEVLNWFPDIRQQLLQSLRALGARLVGGPPPTTVGAGPMAGGPGAPMGGPPMGGPEMAGAGPMAGGPGAPMGGPGMAGAGVGGAAIPTPVDPVLFYSILEGVRARAREKYEFFSLDAAITYLALEAYKEYVDEQILLATAEYRRAREELAELKEIINRELKKLATTPLRR
jgi:hypothetical protein